MVLPQISPISINPPRRFGNWFPNWTYERQFLVYSWFLFYLACFWFPPHERGVCVCVTHIHHQGVYTAVIPVCLHLGARDDDGFRAINYGRRDASTSPAQCVMPGARRRHLPTVVSFISINSCAPRDIKRPPCIQNRPRARIAAAKDKEKYCSIEMGFRRVLLLYVVINEFSREHLLEDAQHRLE